MQTTRFVSSLLALVALTLPLHARLPDFGDPVLLQDLEPGPESSSIDFLLPVDGKGVFLLERDAGPPAVRELWTTDGTPGGTFRIDPDELGLQVRQPDFRHAEDLVYFVGIHAPSGEPGLWRTDGTAAGTVELARDLVLGPAFTRGLGNSPVVFAAGPPEQDLLDVDLALWTTDGTPAGTHEIHDLTRGYSGFPAALIDVDGTIYFLDDDPAGTAIGLWRTDGTSAGTELVRVADDGSFRSLRRGGTGLYMRQHKGADGSLALWHSDGTAAGTRELREFGRAPADGGELQLIAELPDGRTLWTVRTEMVAHSLWVSDGTAEGTFRLLDFDDVSPNGSDTTVLGRTAFGDSVYFQVIAPGGFREMWRTDGTVDGTFHWLESRPELEENGLGLLLTVAGRLLLSIDRPSFGREPWISDGTATGTRLLADVCPGSCSSFSGPFTETVGPALFPAQTEDGDDQLWASDLTAAGTQRLTDFAGGVLPHARVIQGIQGQQLLLPDHFLFTADDGTTGYELWSLPLPAFDPLPPPGPWHRSEAVPGFETKVRITPPNGEPITGSPEPECIPETACFSGALEGRSEVFVRVVGPKPNGMLWPTLVKFSTSQIEVWIRQIATDVTRYYRLEGARPGFDELPGLFDRGGFEPQP